MSILKTNFINAIAEQTVRHYQFLEDTRKFRAGETFQRASYNMWKLENDIALTRYELGKTSETYNERYFASAQLRHEIRLAVKE